MAKLVLLSILDKELAKVVCKELADCFPSSYEFRVLEMPPEFFEVSLVNFNSEMEANRDALYFQTGFFYGQIAPMPAL